jgi:hypothetical protein
MYQSVDHLPDTPTHTNPSPLCIPVHILTSLAAVLSLLAFVHLRNLPLIQLVPHFTPTITQHGLDVMKLALLAGIAGALPTALAWGAAGE